MASPQVYQFAIYDPNTGAPKTGVSPTFDAYEDESGIALTQPSITEVGNGFYSFAPTFSAGHLVCFIINTRGNSPLHLAGWLRPEDLGIYFGTASPESIVFAVYDGVTGSPKAGVACLFTSYQDDLGNPLAQPPIQELGAGLYKFTPTIPANRQIIYVLSTNGNSPQTYSGTLRIEDYQAGPGFAVAGLAVIANQITISFSAGFTLDPLSAFVSNPANWTVTGSPAMSITNVAALNGTIVLTTTAQSSGAAYVVNLPTGITANGGTQGLVGATAIAFGGVAGPPAIALARSVDARTLDVVFVSPPIASSALQASNYSAAGLTISAVQQMSSVWYRLTTSKQTVDQSYTVSYSGL